MRFRLSVRAACLVATAALAGCGSSPTEPMSSSMTSLRIIVTTCDLGGSVFVGTESASLGMLPTPCEATFMLSPGPHHLTFKRGNEMFGGAVLPDDPLASLAPGATAAIVLRDPGIACFATAN